MIRFTYKITINNVSKGEIALEEKSSKKAEQKAIKFIKDDYNLSESDVIGLNIIKIEIIGE